MDATARYGRERKEHKMGTRKKKTLSEPERIAGTGDLQREAKKRRHGTMKPADAAVPLAATEPTEAEIERVVASANETVEQANEKRAAEALKAVPKEQVDNIDMTPFWAAMQNGVKRADLLPIVDLLDSINRKLGTLIERLDPREIMATYVKLSALRPMEPPPPPSKEEPVSGFSTENGVRLGDAVYVAYVPGEGVTDHKPRVYAGKVTAITHEGVTVYVEEDNSEDEYAPKYVFLQNEEGNRAAKRVIEEEIYDELERAATRGEILVQLLSDEDLDADAIKDIPHRNLMSALARIGITNFNLKKKGTERYAEILERVMAYRRIRDAKRVLDEAQMHIDLWAKSTHPRALAKNAVTPLGSVTREKDKPASRAAKKDDSEDPTEPEIGDFVIDDHEWYRIVEVRDNVCKAAHNKNGIKRGFKLAGLTFKGRTAKKSTPKWYTENNE